MGKPRNNSAAFSSLRRGTLAPVLLGQNEPLLHGLGPACARISGNRSQGFGIRDAVGAEESCNTAQGESCLVSKRKVVQPEFLYN